MSIIEGLITQLVKNECITLEQMEEILQQGNHNADARDAFIRKVKNENSK